MAPIILASQSPRRRQILEMAGYTFEVISPDVDETNPDGMPGEAVPEHLARKKAAAISPAHTDKLVIAADTVVLIDGKILGKPQDLAAAKQMLQLLSGRMHKVVTGVCLCLGEQLHSFSSVTEVYFRNLAEKQIDHYLENYKPLDKAGAYAIQEWIGLVGIEKINGDYYNVMGLPVGEVILAMEKLH